MTEGDAPKSWIDREVRISVGPNTTNKQLIGVLKEVNDMGVVMHYKDVPDSSPQYVFYPWRLVQAIQVPEEGRLERKPDPILPEGLVESDDPLYPEPENPYRSS